MGKNQSKQVKRPEQLPFVRFARQYFKELKVCICGGNLYALDNLDCELKYCRDCDKYVGYDDSFSFEDLQSEIRNQNLKVAVCGCGNQDPYLYTLKEYSSHAITLSCQKCNHDNKLQLLAIANPAPEPQAVRPPPNARQQAALGMKIAAVTVGLLRLGIQGYNLWKNKSPSMSKQAERLLDMAVDGMSLAKAGKEIADGWEHGMATRGIVVGVVRGVVPAVTTMVLPVRGKAGMVIGKALGELIVWGVEALYDKLEENQAKGDDE